MRGINRKQIIVACFCLVQYYKKSPRSTQEVADISKLDIKQVTKGCRNILEIMKDNLLFLI
ncbi:MAG: hypothetical protein ACKPKO_63850 [Candidatus Fonsibacter sp.]